MSDVSLTSLKHSWQDRDYWDMSIVSRDLWAKQFSHQMDDGRLPLSWHTWQPDEELSCDIKHVKAPENTGAGSRRNHADTDRGPLQSIEAGLRFWIPPRTPSKTQLHVFDLQWALDQKDSRPVKVDAQRSYILWLQLLLTYCTVVITSIMLAPSAFFQIILKLYRPTI